MLQLFVKLPNVSLHNKFPLSIIDQPNPIQCSQFKYRPPKGILITQLLAWICER